MKSGMSPVITVVLLIAISVIAGVTVWFWVSPFTTKPAMSETSLKSFVIVKVYKNATGDGCRSIDIKNTGTTTLEADLYIRDIYGGKAVGANGTNPSYNAYVNISNLESGATRNFLIKPVGLESTIINFTEENITDITSTVTDYPYIRTVSVGDANNDNLNEVYMGQVYTKDAYEVRMYLKNSSGDWVKGADIGDYGSDISPATPFYLKTGDINNDGNDELVVGLYNIQYELKTHFNTSGSWQQVNVPYDIDDVYGFDIGDANNNGITDIVVTMDTSIANNLRLYENATGSWAETQIRDITVDWYSVAVGDADNLPGNEIVTVSVSTDYELRTYKNASGGWIETNISNYDNSSIAVAIGDADNDGNNEIVVGTHAGVDNNLRMYEYNAGNWVETNITNLSSVGIYYATIDDLDLDGNNEIFIGTSNGTNELRMYSYSGGEWIERNISDTPNTVNSISIADADNDGIKDIVVSMSYCTNELRMYVPIIYSASVPFGTYLLRTSTPGYSDQVFTCS